MWTGVGLVVHKLRTIASQHQYSKLLHQKSVPSNIMASVQANNTSEKSTKMPVAKADKLTLIHFNDVYNVEGRGVEPVGGAPRFLTAVKAASENVNPLILFSGDIFAPSIMSTFTKGEQMVPVLNQLGVHCAVYGNHDFDFGLETLNDLVSRTSFPWLMSNVVDRETGRQLADGLRSHVIEWEGRRLGILGLVEREWLDTLATINTDQVDFQDYIDAGNELVAKLRGDGCEVVIALTHMRTPNDIRLAENVEGIDLILGGHDHVYEKHKVNGKFILKSGTDFRQFSKITLDFRQDPLQVDIEAVNVTREYEADTELEAVLSQYSGVVDAKMSEELGELSVMLDGKFSSVRTRETNLGNLVTDIMVAALNADCAVLNSGTLRSDTEHPEGKFYLRDLLMILPMMDPLVLLDVTGAQLLLALENGVSKWPSLEGRFPQVSGISFIFDPSQPPGSRIDPGFVKIGDEFIAMHQHYKLVTKAYLASGRDGYDALAEAPVLVDEECAPNLTSAVQNHFQAIQMRKGKSRRTSIHRQSLVTLSRKTSVVKQLTEDGLIPVSRVSPSRSHSPISEMGKSKSPCRGRQAMQPSVDDLENSAAKLNPGVEGRILEITPEIVKKIKLEKELDIGSLVITEVDEKSSPESPEKEGQGFVILNQDSNEDDK